MIVIDNILFYDNYYFCTTSKYQLDFFLLDISYLLTFAQLRNDHWTVQPLTKLTTGVDVVVVELPLDHDRIILVELSDLFPSFEMAALETFYLNMYLSE